MTICRAPVVYCLHSFCVPTIKSAPLPKVYSILQSRTRTQPLHQGSSTPQPPPVTQLQSQHQTTTYIFPTHPPSTNMPADNNNHQSQSTAATPEAAAPKLHKAINWGKAEQGWQSILSVKKQHKDDFDAMHDFLSDSQSSVAALPDSHNKAALVNSISQIAPILARLSAVNAREIDSAEAVLDGLGREDKYARMERSVYLTMLQVAEDMPENMTVGELRQALRDAPVTGEALVMGGGKQEGKQVKTGQKAVAEKKDKEKSPAPSEGSPDAVDGREVAAIPLADESKESAEQMRLVANRSEDDEPAPTKKVCILHSLPRFRC